MKKQDPSYMLNIDITLSADRNTLGCKSVTTAQSEIVLASMLAGAVISIANDNSKDPHKFAEAVCGTIMEFIDKAEITKPNQQLS